MTMPSELINYAQQNIDFLFFLTVVIFLFLLCFVIALNNKCFKRNFHRTYFPMGIIVISFLLTFLLIKPYCYISFCVSLVSLYFCLCIAEFDPVILSFPGMSWPLSLTCRHFGIFGNTGSGKTIFLRKFFNSILIRQPEAGGMIIEDKSDFADIAADDLKKRALGYKLKILKVNPEHNDSSFVPGTRINILEYGNMPWERWADIISETDESHNRTTGDKDPYFRKRQKQIVANGLKFLDGFMSVREDFLKYLKKRIESKKPVSSDKENTLNEDILHIIPTHVSLDQLYKFITVPDKLSILLNEVKTYISLIQDPAEMENCFKDSIFYLLDKYCGIYKGTMDGVAGGVENSLYPFSHREIAEVFGSPNPNLKLTDIEKGFFISLSIPHHHLGSRRYINSILKNILFNIGFNRLHSKSEGNNGEKKKSITTISVFKKNCSDFLKKSRHNLLLGIFDEAQNIVTNSSEMGDHDVSAKIRSAKVCLVYSTQDYKAFLDRLPKEKAEILYYNLSTKIYYRSPDLEAAKRVSEDLGKKIIYKRAYHLGATMQNSSVNKQENDAPRFTPESMRNLPDYTCIVRHVDGTVRKMKFPPDGFLGFRPTWYYVRKLLGES